MSANSLDGAVHEFVARELKLVEREQAADVAEHSALHASGDLQLLSKRGVVLLNLKVTGSRTGLGGKCLVDFESDTTGVAVLPSHRFRDGDVVLIEPTTSSKNNAKSKSDTTKSEAIAIHGVVYRIKENSITIAVKGDDKRDGAEDADTLKNSNTWWKLSQLANEITYKRMNIALNQLQENLHPNAGLLHTLMGLRPPTFSTLQEKDIQFFDKGLNSSQREAVRHALSAEQIALIHGPFGTGKTQTLAEVIRQLVSRTERLLVCGPSNISIDNIIDRLSHSKTSMLRLGHPARVLPQLLMHTLEVRLQSGDSKDVLNAIKEDMDECLNKIGKTKSYGERKGYYNELKHLRKDLKSRTQQCTTNLIKESQVLLSTLSGSDSKPLRELLSQKIRDGECSKGGILFDTVLIDEAAQALEPECWIAILKARRVILAGDHLQLPPVVKSSSSSKSNNVKTTKSSKASKKSDAKTENETDTQREDQHSFTSLKLDTTMFDRMIGLYKDKIRRMLTVQYRMNEKIMRFSSEKLYEGRLEAAESVRDRVLADLEGVESNETTTSPLVIYDTTGFDLLEASDPSPISNNLLGESKYNEGEANIAFTYVKELISYGVSESMIGVIAPYNAQVSLLQQIISPHYPRIEIHTVDGFQGREKEVIVLSLVRSNDNREIGFLADERRLNVAITRAKRQCCLICDGETVSAKNDFLKDLVEYFVENGELRVPEE